MPDHIPDATKKIDDQLRDATKMIPSDAGTAVADSRDLTRAVDYLGPDAEFPISTVTKIHVLRDTLAAIENDSALRTAIQRRGYWATEPHHADAVLNALLKVCPTLAEER